MTHAELLRKYATDAANEGGMWFSGEYMSVLATAAESMEAENAELRDERDRMYKANVEKNGEILRLLEETAELRELVRELYDDLSRCEFPPDWTCEYRDRMRELGVEVDE